MIRIAIIGTGAVAEIHIQAFKAFPDRCEVRALADLYSEKAEKLARNQGISAFVCKDFREVVSRNDIDLVSVCLPPSVHAEAAVAALEAGKHVIVEKPMASSLEECDAMIRAAEKSGRLLASIAQNRYKIPMMKVKKILESGTAGKSRNSYSRRNAPGYPFPGGLRPLSRWKTGFPEKIPTPNASCRGSTIPFPPFPTKDIRDRSTISFRRSKGRPRSSWMGRRAGRPWN
jgi:predicted dehydrogenase